MLNTSCPVPQKGQNKKSDERVDNTVVKKRRSILVVDPPVFRSQRPLNLAEVFIERLEHVFCNKLGKEKRHTRKHRIDQFEGLVDLFTDLGTSQDNLATDEDQQNDLRLHHTVDETGEQFRFVRTEIVVATSQTLQTDGELDVARTDDVLDFEVCELGVETKLLDNTRVLPRCQFGVILRFGTSDYHLSRGED